MTIERIPCKGGDEYDAFSRRYRRMTAGWNRRWYVDAKRSYARRFRKTKTLAIRQELD